LIIILEDVFLLLGPGEINKDSATKTKKEKKNVQNPSGGGPIAAIITKVVDNLQFLIQNVHIRYEDDRNPQVFTLLS
jgi:hypothetical protein